MRFILILLAACVAAAPAAAEDRLSAELLWQLDRLSAPVVSPDGDQVVVQVTSYTEEEDEGRSRLWLLTTGEPRSQRPLTADDHDASSPVFSPDGSRLAYVAKRGEDEAAQLYVMPMDGPGEAVRLTGVPSGVGAPRWVGDHVYFLSNVWPGQSFEEMAKTLEEEKESKVSAHTWTAMPYAFFDHWLDEEREFHVFRVPADGGDVEPLTVATGLSLTPNGPGTGDYDVSPDERMLAFVADSDQEAVYPDPDVFLLEIGSDSARNLTPDNDAPDSSPLFAPDGRRLAFLAQRTPGFYGDPAKLMIHDLRRGRTRAVLADWDRSVGGLAWAPGSDALYASIGDAATQRAFRLPIDGGEPRALTTSTDYDQLSVANDGTVIARNQSPLYPPRVVRILPGRGGAERLDSFNDAILEGIESGSYESVTYEGSGGAGIQMWVHYPAGFDPGRKYPLFLLIHGGPHGAVTEDFHFRWNAQVFSSWGYVTAWPNFHGSSSFGREFTDSINPDWMTKPYEDVIAAAEWFREQPFIDGERMVAGGGSYGGYLSSVILGREHPFNALVIHAAVYDLYAQNSADFAVHDQRFGPYWESPGLFRELSPHTHAGSFDTPSLVIHGQNDLRVPVGQAFELFRALQTRGVESRLVYYPDENHWVLKRANSLHWYGEVRDWVERCAAPGPRDD